MKTISISGKALKNLLYVGFNQSRPISVELYFDQDRCSLRIQVQAKGMTFRDTSLEITKRELEDNPDKVLQLMANRINLVRDRAHDHETVQLAE